MLLSPTGVDLDNWEEEYKTKSEPSDLQKFSNHLVASFLPNGVVVDNTASDIVANQYEKWLGSGLHVITPNKKANSGNFKYYKVCQENRTQSISLFPFLFVCFCAFFPSVFFCVCFGEPIFQACVPDHCIRN